MTPRTSALRPSGRRPGSGVALERAIAPPSQASRDWLWVAVRKPRFVFATANKVTTKTRAYRRGCPPSSRPRHPPAPLKPRVFTPQNTTKVALLIRFPRRSAWFLLSRSPLLLESRRFRTKKRRFDQNGHHLACAARLIIITLDCVLRKGAQSNWREKQARICVLCDAFCSRGGGIQK